MRSPVATPLKIFIAISIVLVVAVVAVVVVAVAVVAVVAVARRRYRSLAALATPRHIHSMALATRIKTPPSSSRRAALITSDSPYVCRHCIARAYVEVSSQRAGLHPASKTPRLSCRHSGP